MDEVKLSEAVLFQGWPKIPRWNRDIVITEKIDGTNGVIYNGASNGAFLVGSRTQWITPEKDNFGFAKWAYSNKEQLALLGPGYHYGEWWGSGIQRKYGLSQGERRFSLFSVVERCLSTATPERIPCGDPRIEKFQKAVPPCCGLVPILYRGPMCNEAIVESLERLRTEGSRAVPGFMNPEGIVIYHLASRISYKITFEGDTNGKNQE